jgi:prepilin-type N-terminal cleavage/methylation domain-containing protein
MARFLAFRRVFGFRRRSLTRYKQRMSKGFTLLEVMVVACIAAVVLALGLPRAARFLDWIDTHGALRDVTTALPVGRNGVVTQSPGGPESPSSRIRYESTGSVRRDGRVLANAGPTQSWRRPRDSNPVVIFRPTGMG